MNTYKIIDAKTKEHIETIEIAEFEYEEDYSNALLEEIQDYLSEQDKEFGIKIELDALENVKVYSNNKLVLKLNKVIE